MDTQFSFQPIGIVESCFPENFGVPRQPGLVPEARGRIRLLPPYDQADAVRGLEGFSHLWIVFVFHRLKGEVAKTTVRPPRLGGNARLGVFASRATHRPNPIGLSLVKLEKVASCAGHTVLEVSGLDIVDGTPVLDIKPYLPYAESIPDATAGYANEAPAFDCEVILTEQAGTQAKALESCYPQFISLLRKVLSLDPRPAFHQHRDDVQPPRIYGLSLYDQNIRWQMSADKVITVLDINPLEMKD